MTPAKLRAIGEQVYGHGWQTRLSEYLNVNDRTVRRWAAGGYPIPTGVAQLVSELVRIAPPAAGTTAADDRDDACHAALSPRLTALANDAIRAGWHPAEIIAAMLSWTVEQGRAAAGTEAMARTLRLALRELAAGK